MGVERKKLKQKFRIILDAWKENASPAEYELICIGIYIVLPVVAVLLILGLWLFIKNHEAFRTLALSLAAIVGLPLLIWRGTSLDRSSKAAEKQAENASKSHVADTYTKAIEQLGAVDNEGKPRLELRLGGLYALEKIAKANEDYHPQIMEVLCAYVRLRCKIEIKDKDENKDEKKLKTQDEKQLRIDVKSCLTVIGRRKVSFDVGMIDLSRIDFSHVNLNNEKLHYTNLRESSLTKANLDGADLNSAVLMSAFLIGANLISAKLKGAYITDANLEGAYITDANLEGADLRWASLMEADFRGANLTKAKLIKTDLNGTDFDGADLSEANLLEAKNLSCQQIKSAKIDRKTILPDYIKVTWAEDDSYTCEMVEDSN